MGAPAFTIVEVLLASAITVVIVVMLGTMFGSLTGTTMRSNQQIDAFRDARAALQLMERDIVGLVRARKAPYLAISEQYPEENTTPKNQQLYLLTAVKDSSGGTAPPHRGDVSAVGYYCKWETNRYTLRRYFRSSYQTFAAFQANGAGNFLPLTEIYKPDTPVGSDDLLAAYVWNLQVALFDASGAPVTSPLVYDESATATAPLPGYLEISFHAMSPQAARTAIAVGANAGDWMDSVNSTTHQRLIAPHKYLFRTRVRL